MTTSQGIDPGLLWELEAEAEAEKDLWAMGMPDDTEGLQCLYCKQLFFNSLRAISDDCYEGPDCELWCNKDHWDAGNLKAADELVAVLLHAAATCPDYEGV